MLLSLIRDTEFYDSDISNYNNDYENMKYYVTFTQGMKVLSDEVLYERTGGNVVVGALDTSASVGTFAYDPAITEIVQYYALANDDVFKQPSEYSGTDSGWTATYSELYSEIVTSAVSRPFTGFDVFGGADWRYTLYKNPASDTGWSFTIKSDSNNINITTDVRVLEGVVSEFDNEIGNEIDPGNGESYIPKAFIIDIENQHLYMRTNVVNKLYEYKTTSESAKHIVSDLRYFEGWTPIGMSNSYAALDKKTYTISKFKDDRYLEVTSKNSFDCVAILNVLCDSISVEFKDGSTVVHSIDHFPIDTSRDEDGRLEPTSTDIVFYCPSDIPANGTCKVTFHVGTDIGVCHVGTVKLGLSVDAGFTNLIFSNRFKDYSPYEKDQWGNVHYVDGVKTNLFKCTIDVPLTKYDMTYRLIRSIGGREVIVNASDNKDNNLIDNVNYFASTMMVGRASNFELKTKLSNKRISEMATYSFEIESIV